MSLSIAIYSNDSFKEFILPSINNSDYELFIRKDQMKTQGDLRLVMEVVNNTWTVKSDKDYRLFVKDNRYDSVDLMDGLIANVVTKDNDNLTIISTEVENPFHAYDKYRISNQASITIGKDASNDISCDYLGVSREHATILHVYRLHREEWPLHQFRQGRRSLRTPLRRLHKRYRTSHDVSRLFACDRYGRQGRERQQL